MSSGQCQVDGTAAAMQWPQQHCFSARRRAPAATRRLALGRRAVAAPRAPPGARGTVAVRFKKRGVGEHQPAISSPSARHEIWGDDDETNPTRYLEPKDSALERHDIWGDDETNPTRYLEPKDSALDRHEIWGDDETNPTRHLQPKDSALDRSSIEKPRPHQPRAQPHDGSAGVGPVGRTLAVEVRQEGDSLAP